MHDVSSQLLQVVGISRNEELAWQAVEDLKEEFPGAAISYKVSPVEAHKYRDSSSTAHLRQYTQSHTRQPSSCCCSTA